MGGKEKERLNHPVTTDREHNLSLYVRYLLHLCALDTYPTYLGFRALIPRIVLAISTFSKLLLPFHVPILANSRFPDPSRSGDLSTPPYMTSNIPELWPLTLLPAVFRLERPGEEESNDPGGSRSRHCLKGTWSQYRQGIISPGL